MRRFTLFGTVLWLTFLLSCGTLRNGSTQLVHIAYGGGECRDVAILNRSGGEICRGKTPIKVSVRRGYSYFTPARYYVYEVTPLDSLILKDSIMFRTNSDYWLNLGYFNVVGLVVIDPVLGGLWSTQDTLLYFNK